jgi:hypothetical protein
MAEPISQEAITMLVEYPYARRYLFTALESQPELFERALEGLTEEEADRRPDPDRFTIREIVSHIAEWEGIFLERMRRICAEDHPTLPGYDEGELAIAHNYAVNNVSEQLAIYREGRRKMVDFLKERADSDWKRTGDRQEIGILTLEALALLIPLHDDYHLIQVNRWRKR